MPGFMTLRAWQLLHSSIFFSNWMAHLMRSYKAEWISWMVQPKRSSGILYQISRMGYLWRTEGCRLRYSLPYRMQFLRNSQTLDSGSGKLSLLRMLLVVYPQMSFRQLSILSMMLSWICPYRSSSWFSSTSSISSFISSIMFIMYIISGYITLIIIVSITMSSAYTFRFLKSIFRCSLNSSNLSTELKQLLASPCRVGLPIFFSSSSALLTSQSLQSLSMLPFSSKFESESYSNISIKLPMCRTSLGQTFSSQDMGLLFPMLSSTNSGMDFRQWMQSKKVIQLVSLITFSFNSSFLKSIILVSNSNVVLSDSELVLKKNKSKEGS